MIAASRRLVGIFFSVFFCAFFFTFLGGGCATDQPLKATQFKATQSTDKKISADIMFVNANVLTMTAAKAASNSPPSTVVVTGDEIIAVGNNDLAQRYRADKTIDLNGATLMPGFNDTHIHINGNARRYIDLSGVTSIQEIQTRVSQRAAQLGPREWITGYGWSEDELAEQRKPNRHDLDQAAPHNPVVLTRAGAHSAVASSSALALAGFEKNSTDPQNGSLERDQNNELTGIVRERHDILLALVPTALDSELESSLSTNLKDLFSLGITSITQAMANEAALARWQRVYERAPTQHPRAAVQLVWPGKEKFMAFKGRSGDGDKHFRLGPLKVFVDGGFTGPAAFTKKPYRGEQTYRGELALTERELAELLEVAHGAGWQLGIHAIGDAAIELVVQELAAVLARMPRKGHRHYLNHFTVMPDEQTMQTMAANGIWISQQPNFTYTLEGRYQTYLDGERLTKNNSLRTPMSHGIFMALSSDILPIGPMTGIYAAVTRRGMSGKQYGPEEALSVGEALRGYTANAAWFTFEENTKGTIEAGKLADLIVFEQNPLTLPHDELLNLKVDQTWLGGQQVYQRTN